ncbi:MAG: hypothetical protein ACOYN4_10805 [Bacteroidales bacterium]
MLAIRFEIFTMERCAECHTECHSELAELPADVPIEAAWRSTSFMEFVI